mgnify:CR=1 FL=1
MPIYQYECQECGAVVERIQSYDDDPPSCPETVDIEEECGEPYNSAVAAFDRVIGKPNAHFKGDGFHSTDYDDSSNPAS